MDTGHIGGSFVFLQQLRAEVYQDIYWRLAGGMSREIMLPIEAGQRTIASRG
jgi:hypothetical protein